jgi:hypothetical protein
LGHTHRRISEKGGARAAAALAFVGVTLGSTALPEPVSGERTISAASELYVLNCQGCHGARGEVANDDIRPLAFAFSTFTQTTRGRAYLVRIPGIANAPLADGELTKLLNYLAAQWRPSIRNGKVPKFNESTVSTLRQKPLQDIDVERAALIREFVATRMSSRRTDK